MKNVILFLLLPVLLFSQHFTENGNNRVPVNIPGVTTGAWSFDSIYRGNTNLGTDTSASNNDLTANNFSANFADEITTGSFNFLGGKYLDFNGTNEHFSLADGSGGSDYDPGTGSFSIDGWIYYPANVTGFKDVASKYAAGNGWEISVNTGVFRCYFLSSGGTFQATNDFPGNGWLHFVYVADRNGNANIYVNGVAGTPVDISTQSSFNMNNAIDFYIGRTATVYWNDGISFIAYHNRVLTVKEIKERWALPRNWVSKQGEVIRDAWNIGINGNTLKVWIGNGTAQTISITGDSTRYNIALGAINLSSDSLYIATDTDTVYTALANSTLPAGFQWTLQIDAQDKGTYVMVDNLSLTTTTIVAKNRFPKTMKYLKYRGF